MAMGGGSQGGALSEINVTPLIDVLLVLIIIFMVIQPTTPKGLDTLVPQPPKNKTNDQPNDRTIVVQVLANGASVNYKINDQSFAKDDIAPELTKIFETRQEKVMFIKGDRDLDFGSVAEAVGFGKTAGVTNIAIITPQVEAGH
jgi:biopolymer transport protein ExbD/biopolymer transport protein TolR